MKSAVRGAMITFRADPFIVPDEESLTHLSDALIVIENGKIVAVGDAAELLPSLPPGTDITHYRDALIVPGFIDCHAHYAQTPMIAAFGEQLLDWLNLYTFNTEQAFGDPAVASEVAAIFLDEQLRHGVTTSAVFGTVHPESVEALFDQARRRNVRMLAGKVCMDRNAPASLLDSAQRAYDESEALIGRWHGVGRLEYAITPRFAPTSSPQQLEALGALAARYPDMPIQTHLAENRDEMAWVARLFPDARDYTDVYARHGLVRPRAIFGHGIHLTEPELDRLAENGASLAHCPTSNFFLGSGCFDVRRTRQRSLPVLTGLATDVGAGTSFSMLTTMNEAYKAAQFNGHALSAVQAFYLATRGGARALGVEDKVGSIAAGMDADLAVLDMAATPLIRYRMTRVRTIGEAMFVLMMLGDDRAVRDTWVAGCRWMPSGGLAGAFGDQHRAGAAQSILQGQAFGIDQCRQKRQQAPGERCQGHQRPMAGALPCAKVGEHGNDDEQYQRDDVADGRFLPG
ncbi:guanine deaminase [Paludibacterium paludis]|uniref:Guanine deaminase n=1 Tax=Paludibacterium paludis TaxID=1225769 RepID=A0A918UA68_9NEIS|nr:guanine deaminase [Paludibacterium paludis]